MTTTQKAAFLPLLESRSPIETQSHFNPRIRPMVGAEARAFSEGGKEAARWTSAAIELRLDGRANGGLPPESHRLRYGGASLGLHVGLVAAAILIPLLRETPAPEPALGVRAFFAEPKSVLMPPPPPPPAPARTTSARATAPPETLKTHAFVAPAEVPDQIAAPSMGLDTGGVAGGVEGGVAGGVAGGIVGGLPSDLAPLPKAEAPVVRIGGDIREPKKVLYVPPVYPHIAAQAGLYGLVILEARVGTDGYVKETTVLRGQPVFDQAAQDAVRQWRYQPLLLNGQPMEFILTVTVKFNLRTPE
jgi:protein TonB